MKNSAKRIVRTTKGITKTLHLFPFDKIRKDPTEAAPLTQHNSSTRTTRQRLTVTTTAHLDFFEVIVNIVNEFEKGIVSGTVPIWFGTKMLFTRRIGQSVR